MSTAVAIKPVATEMDEEEDIETETGGESELVAETSVEQQVFDIIHNSGQEGIHMTQVLRV